MQPNYFLRLFVFQEGRGESGAGRPPGSVVASWSCVPSHPTASTGGTRGRAGGWLRQLLLCPAHRLRAGMDEHLPPSDGGRWGPCHSQRCSNFEIHSVVKVEHQVQRKNSQKRGVGFLELHTEVCGVVNIHLIFLARCCRGSAYRFRLSPGRKKSG